MTLWRTPCYTYLETLPFNLFYLRQCTKGGTFHVMAYAYWILWQKFHWKLLKDPEKMFFSFAKLLRSVSGKTNKQRKKHNLTCFKINWGMCWCGVHLKIQTLFWQNSTQVTLGYLYSKVSYFIKNCFLTFSVKNHLLWNIFVGELPVRKLCVIKHARYKQLNTEIELITYLWLRLKVKVIYCSVTYDARFEMISADESSSWGSSVVLLPQWAMWFDHWIISWTSRGEYNRIS